MKTLDLQEKNKMQSDILDEQYSIFCEVDANITAKYGQREEFKRLGVSEKQEIIYR